MCLILFDVLETLAANRRSSLHRQITDFFAQSFCWRLLVTLSTVLSANVIEFIAMKRCVRRSTSCHDHVNTNTAERARISTLDVICQVIATKGTDEEARSAYDCLLRSCVISVPAGLVADFLGLCFTESVNALSANTPATTAEIELVASKLLSTFPTQCNSSANALV